MKNVDTFCPTDKKEWRKWLELNHEKKGSVWLIFYKKSSIKVNLTWSESVDEALCFGWIDSVKKTIDKEKYKQYFSKRKATSTWSQINKNKVDYLISNNLLQEAGFKAIEVAKNNGWWTFLDQIDALIIPQDLKEEFTKHKGSMEFFDNQSKSAKKILLYWIISAKRAETRQKRVIEIAENASRKLKPKQFR